METQIKQKLCWNCEARVDFGVESCPSCGVYLSTSPLLEQAAPDLVNNHSAPYQHVVVEEESSIPESPYQFEDADNSEEPSSSEEAGDEEEVGSDYWKAELVPMGLLFAGSIFSLFGLALLLFAEDGVLTLKWNGDYWYLYLLLGVPFLTFGWRALQQTCGEDADTSISGGSR